MFLFIFGGYLVYSQNLPYCSNKARNAVKQKKINGFINRRKFLLDFFEQLVSKVIKLSEQKHKMYARMLQTQNIDKTPEEYLARAIAESSSYCVMIAIPCFVLLLLPVNLLSEPALRLRSVTPLLLLISIAFGLYTYKKYEGKLKTSYLKYILEIEADLPKLCSVINSRLRMTSNVQEILTGFIPVANPSMESELLLTLEDMKTGSKEVALLRFEGRISSAKVSDVVRGLISVLNGDDQRIFFQSKQEQFNNDFITVKRKEISKRPMKLTIPSLMVFLFFFLIVLYPLLTGGSEFISNII